MSRTKKLLLFSFLLLVIGFVLPLLMIMHIIRSSFFLNFLAFGSSVSGLFIGIMASASIVIRSRKKK